MDDINFFIDKINYVYRNRMLIKCFVIVISLVTIFMSLYLFILPAFTLNSENSYVLNLIDSYDYSWKEGLTTSYNLDLYFVDTNGNNIEGKDITIEIGEDSLVDDPYGFGYAPSNGESTRGLDIIEYLGMYEYTLSTGEKYIFDHAEVYVNNSWQEFSKDSEHWDIWCQYSSSSSDKGDYGWRGKYGDNVSYTVTSDTKYKFVYKLVRYGKEDSVYSLGSDSGIVFNLFNYSGTNDKSGINDNGLFGYFNFRDSTLSTSSVINSNTDADGFTENRAKVLSRLENGYPVFDCRGYCDNKSLGYLFGDGLNGDGEEVKGVTGYKPSNTLLQKEIVDGVEYYYYDSSRNAVDYDTENNFFMLRDYVERGYQLSSYPSEINRYEFLPFNYWSSSRNLSTLDGTDFTYNYEKEEIDHWFGMTMEFDFYMPKDGMINGSDMVFSFSGDDDVWVFIDDVLVLDLGGTHGAVDGNINFNTGEVTSYLNWNGTLGEVNKTSIYDSFVTADSLDTTSWSSDGKTFENYTRHTLKFFYLERGAAISNCKIRFNIPVLPSGSLSVQKLFNDTYDYDEEHEFTLYDVTTGNAVSDVKYTIGGNENYTDEFGRFKLKVGEVASFILTNYHTYYVEEINPGFHSVSYSCTIDGILCDVVNRTKEFTIDPESSYEVIFTNKIKTYNLNISKIAYNSSYDEVFKFKIELDNTSGNKIEVSSDKMIKNSDGILTFDLKDSEMITIKDIPIATNVKISEIDHDGYNVVMKLGDVTLANSDNYEFIMDGDKDITIYNIPGYVLPDTGGSGIIPYIISGLFMIFISIICVYYFLKLKEGGY